MKVGDLVTSAWAPEGMPDRILAVRHLEGWISGDRHIMLDPLGGSARYGAFTEWEGAERSLEFREDIRPLADAEAIALAAWLLTGDPDARWPGNFLEGNGYTLLLGAAWWQIYRGPIEDGYPIVESRTLPLEDTTQKRRVAVCRAFLVYLCRASG